MAFKKPVYYIKYDKKDKIWTVRLRGAPSFIEDMSSEKEAQDFLDDINADIENEWEVGRDSGDSDYGNPGAAWHTKEAEYWKGRKLSNVNKFYAKESRNQGIPNPLRKSNIMSLLVLGGIGFLVYKLIKNKT